MKSRDRNNDFSPNHAVVQDKNVKYARGRASETAKRNYFRTGEPVRTMWITRALRARGDCGLGRFGQFRFVGVDFRFGRLARQYRRLLRQKRIVHRG